MWGYPRATPAFAVLAAAVPWHAQVGPVDQVGLAFRAGGVTAQATRVVAERRDGAAYTATLATDDPAARTIAVRIAPTGDGVTEMTVENRVTEGPYQRSGAWVLRVHQGRRRRLDLQVAPARRPCALLVGGRRARFSYADGVLRASVRLRSATIVSPRSRRACAAARGAAPAPRR
jgi:hypothetical protein